MSDRRTFLHTAATAAAAGAGLAALSGIERPAEAAGKSKDKAGASQTGFFGQMQVTANVVRGGRPAGALQLDAGLYSTDAALQQRAVGLAPVLRSQWRATAQDFVNRYHTPGRVPDANLLAQQLQATTNRVLGSTGARVMMVALILR